MKTIAIDRDKALLLLGAIECAENEQQFGIGFHEWTAELSQKSFELKRYLQSVIDGNGSE